MKKLILIAVTIFSFNYLNAQCDIKTINRPDGITIKHFTPKPIIKISSYEVGIAIYKNINVDDFFISLSVLFKNMKTRDLNRDLVIQTTNSLGLRLKQVLSKQITMNGRILANAMYKIEKTDFEELSQYQIKSVFFYLGDSLEGTFIMENKDVLIKELECFKSENEVVNNSNGTFQSIYDKIQNSDDPSKMGKYELTPEEQRYGAMLDPDRSEKGSVNYFKTSGTQKKPSNINTPIIILVILILVILILLFIKVNNSNSNKLKTEKNNNIILKKDSKTHNVRNEVIENHEKDKNDYKYRSDKAQFDTYEDINTQFLKINIDEDLKSLFDSKKISKNKYNYTQAANYINETIDNYRIGLLKHNKSDKVKIIAETHIMEFKNELLNRVKKLSVENSKDIPFSQPKDFLKYDIEEDLKKIIKEEIEERGISSQNEINEIINEACNDYRLIISEKISNDKELLFNGFKYIDECNIKLKKEIVIEDKKHETLLHTVNSHNYNEFVEDKFMLYNAFYKFCFSKDISELILGNTFESFELAKDMAKSISVNEVVSFRLMKKYLKTLNVEFKENSHPVYYYNNFKFSILVDKVVIGDDSTFFEILSNNFNDLVDFNHNQLAVANNFIIYVKNNIPNSLYVVVKDPFLGKYALRKVSQDGVSSKIAFLENNERDTIIDSILEIS